MRREDWSLVAFTLGVQASCGMVLGAVVADASGAPVVAVRAAALLASPLLVASLALSLGHLGRPLHAWRSIANTMRSPLSREIVVTGLFVGSTFAYGAMWAVETGVSRLAAGAVASIVGVAAVLAGAFVYTVPARPVWHSWWVPVSFVGATLLLAGVTALVVGAMAGAEGVSVVAGAIGATGGLLTLASGVGLATRVRTVAAADTNPGTIPGEEPLDGGAPRLIFIAHVALGGVLPITAGAFAWTGALTPPSVAVSLTLATVIGAVCGRWLMFRLGASVPEF